jgi:exosortase/archaeosortase family protein
MQWQENIKNYFTSSYNWRLAIAFAIGLVVSALFMDFEFLAEPARSHSITTAFSNFLALTTGAIIKVLGYDITIVDNAIWFTSNNGVYFDFGCLGYREIIWFGLFIMLAPGPSKHKFWYIPTGIIIIELSNILRATSIAISNFHAPQTFDLIHAQGTVWFVYGTVLALWLFWLNFFRK